MCHIKTILTSMLFFCFLHVNAQKKYPNTLLWKITGNGLTKPSYLFGTMHLTEKRLFYFTDSTYDAIEKTEGFAIEVNPEDIADSLLSRLDLTDKSSRIKDLLSEKEYNKIKKQLEKKYKVPPDDLTTKQIQRYRRQKIYKSKEGDMATFMDMYLYNIAQQQGKWTGGIEDVNDQLGPLDEMGGSMSPADLVSEDSIEAGKFIDKMKKIYLKQDLDGIESIFNYSKNGKDDHLDMIKRNHKMAKRIDSLSSIRSCFFAIGAAHLPGDSGVIKFLQDKGFTLSPVISNKTIAPNAYTYTHKEKDWISFSDDTRSYSVKMPGKPTLVQASEVLPIYMYMDLSNMSAFGVGVMGATGAAAGLQDRIDLMVQSYKKSGYEILDKKTIEVQGAKGLELLTYLEDKGYYKIQLLGYENKMFLLIFGSKTKEETLSPTGTRFLNSIVINKETNLPNEKWNLFTDQQCGISLLMPGKMKFKQFTAAENGGNYKTYIGNDLKDGNYYMLVISDIGPGYYIKGDTSTWNTYMEQYKVSMKIDSMDKTPFRYRGYEACKYTGYKTEKGQELFMQCIAILRGGRSYHAWVIASKEKKDIPEIPAFFESIDLLAYDPVEWKDHGDNIRFYGPAPFSKKPANEYETEQEIYYSIDEKSNTSFTLDKKILSKYFWINSDSLYWENKLDFIKTTEDSVLYSNYYRNASGSCADFIIALEGTTQKKQLKYIITNDTLYCLYGFLSDEMYNDKRVKKLFSSFAVNNGKPLTIYENKTLLLLQDLQSSDSATKFDAIYAMRNAPFSKTDLPDLQRAFLLEYNNDDSDYRNINDELGNAIIEINDESTIGFIKNKYVNDQYESLRPKMINMLVRHKTAGSFAALKELLLLHKSIKKEIGMLAYYDSLALAKNFFPETGVLLNDSIVGPSLATLAINLVDSNILSLEVIRPYEDKLVELAVTESKKFALDKDVWDFNSSQVIRLLAALNSNKSNAGIMLFLHSKQLTVKKEAILALLKNKVTVSSEEIYSIAADDGLRAYFYTQLKEINCEPLFPGALKTARAFAASYAYNYMEESDYTISSISFIKEKVKSKGGEKLRYYIFKAILEGVDDPQTVIVGPFDYKNVSYTPEENGNDKVWLDDEPYSIKKIDAALDRMLNPKEAITEEEE